MAAESPSLSDDHFSVLGLVRGHALPRADIEEAYLQRAAAAHPDRVAGQDAATQRRALEASAAINVAYRVLRDPVTRLEYLVKLGGIDLDSTDPQTGAPSPSQAFLMDMIERRELLGEAQARGRAAAEAFRAEVQDAEEDALDRATAAFDDSDLRGAAQWLVHRRYWQRLLEEIEGE